MAASVVDLPEPVGPVTSTMPRGFSARSPKILGAFNCSSVRIFEGMVRSTAAAPRFWLKALTRKRARPSISKEKSTSRNSSYCLRWPSFMMSYHVAATGVHGVAHHGVDLLGVQRVDVDAAHVPVHADHRRKAGGQVKVGRLVLD